MKWKAKYLLISESIYEFAAGLFGPIYAVFVANIGGDLLTAGWAWSLFAITSGITLYIMGKLEDKIKRDNIIILIGFILASIGFLGYIFISEPWHLFLVQIILGFGWAFGTPAMDAVYSKNLEKKKMDSGWGTWESSMRIMEGISAFIGAIIAFTFGFKILFLIMFILSLIPIYITFNFIIKNNHFLKYK